MRLKQNIIRMFISLAIFTFCLYLVPNFNVENIWILFISAFFLVVVDYLVSTITNIHDYPLGRGVIGFFSAVVIIYSTQFFISGFYISFIASLICALIYSAIDYFLPNR